MGLRNPLGLLALIAIPVIIILYMLRPKNKPVKISSLYLWEMAKVEIESAARFNKLKTSILLYLQIIAVILIALLLAGLFIFSNKNVNDVVVLVDCSLSMQSTDVSPTRMDLAKKEAIDYINTLNEDTSITLISLKDIPEVLLTKASSKNKVINVINSLTPVDGYTEMELVEQAVAVTKDSGDTQVIYFGDKYITGVSNISIMKSNNNYGIGQIAYTLYDTQGTVSVLGEIYNQSDTVATIPVSIYADGSLYTAKQVTVEASSSEKLIFTDIPSQVSEITLQIDKEDILSVDNRATTFITQTEIKKAVLVTEGNMFLEKILKLSDQVELYIANPADIEGLEGYDLYVFDSVAPKELPKDGGVLFFNPPDSDAISHIGYRENEPISLMTHEVTSHIENPDFLIGLTKVYETPMWAETIMTIESGTCAFAGVLDGVRMVVYGFDIHNTDLPLCVEFPIMMINTLDYLVPSNMISQTNIRAGDEININIYPDTETAYVIDANNNRLTLDIQEGESLYRSTYEIGNYQIVQVSKEGESTQSFAVNAPSPENKDLAIEGENGEHVRGLSRQSLSIIIGILLLLVMVIEWFIYNYRRKINEIRL